MRKAWITLFILGFSLNAYAKDYSDVEITKSHVAGRVFMLQGAGGNIGVSVGPDGLLMVDNQFGELSEKIQATLDSFKQGELKYLINTHWHGDHTGGNEHFGSRSTIFSHTNTRLHLSKDQYVKFFDKSVFAREKPALPVVTFDDSINIYFNEEKIRIMHFPKAHTDGDVAVFFEDSKVLHMGDLFFNGGFPYIDRDRGGAVGHYKRAVRSALSLIDDEYKIIPGHGPLATKEDLHRYSEMLEKTTSIIEFYKSENMSKKEMIKKGILKDWEEWGNGFIKTEMWIDLVLGGA